MWRILRAKRLHKYKFKRQFIIKPYIVDFVCLEKKLIVELDGEYHKNTKSYDKKRTTFLEENGYQVLRFWNKDLFNRGEEVISQIVTILETRFPGTRAATTIL